MFVVKKKINGNEYYYLRESKRIDGKVKAVSVAYLGKDKKKAEEKANKLISNMGKKSEDFKEKTSLTHPVRKKDKLTEDLKSGNKKYKVMGDKKELTIEELAAFCKRKGFVYPSGDIYGGFAGFWDFGHLGVELKNNLKNEWWDFHVRQRDDVVGIDGSIITNPKVWKASGHIDNFSDVFVICKKCKKAGKVDKNEVGKVKCDNCGGDYDEKTAKEFKLMFKTDIGKEDYGYLRPETAQLIFTNFKYVQENARLKLPFGIAQIGKAFRNEIAPRDFLFRMREFEQMELEYFVDPDEKCDLAMGESEILVFSEEMQNNGKDSEKMKFKEALSKKIIKTDWHAYWLEQEFLWFISLGANPNKFRIRQHVKDEKSHYAIETWDFEYHFPFGWKELQGMANRTDFDLKQHQEFSKTKMEIITQYGKKILPHVVSEPSQGVERALLVFLFDSYVYDEERKNVVLKLHPKLSPVKAAVFPIVKNDKSILKLSWKIYKSLRVYHNVLYDVGGSLGRRYSRADESGVPIAITIDNESLSDDMVTIRDRDSTEQIRVRIDELKEIVDKVIKGNNLLELGKSVKTRIK